jgi:Ni/Fe-hydrogenase subunit HybB-like protein
MVGLYAALIMTISKKFRSPRGLFCVSVIVIIAIAAYRINLISIAQLIPLYHELGEIQYVPNMHEVAPLIGLMAALMLLYAILTKVLPLEDKVHKTGE